MWLWSVEEDPDVRDAKERTEGRGGAQLRERKAYSSSSLDASLMWECVGGDVEGRRRMDVGGVMVMELFILLEVVVGGLGEAAMFEVWTGGED